MKPWQILQIIPYRPPVSSGTLIYQLHFNGDEGGKIFADDVATNAWDNDFANTRDCFTTTVDPKFGSASLTTECIPYFLDNFNGTLNALAVNHIPDIAPTGFDWSSGTSVLSGTGNLVIPSGQTFDYVNAVGFTLTDISSKYVVTLVARLPG